MRRVVYSAGLGGISPQVSVRSPRLRGASGHREVEGWVAEEALPTVPFVTPGPAQLAHPPMATAGPPDPVPTERDTVRRPPPGPHASHKPFPQKEGWRGPRTSILGRPVTLQLAACSGGPREEGSREPGLHGCHLPNSFIYLSSSYFLPHPQHVESSGLGIEPVPQGRQRRDPEPAAPQGDSL